MTRCVNLRPKKWSALLLVGLLTLSMLSLPTVSAGTTQVMDAHLPSPRDGTASVATPDAIYIFGGDTGSARSDEILRYDVRNDTLAVMAAKLPSPRSGMSAVFDGTYAYIFGGWGSPYSDDIVRYDPATDTVSVLPETLPSARIYTSAVWTGQYAYIFGGGVSSATTTDEIVRYEPATGTVTTMSATLPSARYGTSAVYDGQYAYIIGGITLSTNTKHDQIVRYDPATDSVSVIGATLPRPLYHTSAVYAAGAAHIFGGYDCGSGLACNTIVEVAFDTGTVTTNTTVLTTERYLTSAAYYGRYAYIIGGLDGTRKDQILRHGAIEPNNAPEIAELPDLTHQATIPLAVNVSAADADNDFVTLDATLLPAGATFTDHGNGTGTFEWTPLRSQTGSHEVRLQAEDGTDTSTEAFWISVTDGPDRAPTFDPIGDQNATAEEAFTLAITATDPDSDPITLTMTGPTGAGLSDQGDGTGTITWTPTRSQEGTHGFTVTASAAGNDTSTSFNVTVALPPNRAPVLEDIADREQYFGDEITIDFQATDPDGDAIVLALTPVPGNATFTDNGDGTATLFWGIDSSHQGTHNLTITADDGNTTSTRSFEVRVYSGPPPYLVPIDDVTLAEGHEVTIVVAGADPQGLPITLAIAPLPLPGNATFVDHGNSTGAFHWITGHEDAGTYTLTVTADNGDRTTDETFTITVTDVDRPPEFTAGPGTVSIGAGEDLIVPVAATDPDGTPVTLTATSLPTGATFIDNGDGTATLTWNDAAPIGTYTVTLGATSGSMSINGTLQIVVLERYAFSISQVGPSRIFASPHEIVPLQVTLTNRGAESDTYTLSAQDTAGQPEGWTFGATSPVTVAAGTSSVVTVNITVPEDGTYAKPRIVIQSTGDPALKSQMSWLIYVPVRIQIDPIDQNPSILELEAFVLFNGTVNLTWNNGEPARNLSFSYRHVIHTEPIVVHSGDVQADANGSWEFGGTEHFTMGIGPVVSHHLYVDVPYGRFIYSGVETWNIGPPWP